jgi:tripartite-type tricarboxylate transporter receptor subunit TctC
MNMRKETVASLAGITLLLTLALCLASVSSAAEKKYPSRPIEIVCGYPPGGAMDLTMRIWGKYLEKRLGVPVVPVNKPGAGAILGCTYIANAQPDGYTLGSVGDHLVINIISGRAKYSLEDFRYVCLATYIANVLAVPVDSQWKTIQDFIDYAKKNPGVKYGHPGIGSSNHIRMENFNKFANLKLVPVPLNGDAEIIPAVLGKHLPIGSFGAAAAKAQADAGKLRILMSFDPPAEIGLDPKVPDLHTVFGKNVPDVDIGSYLVVPRKTPDDIVKLLERTMENITKDPEFIKEFRANNMKVKFVDGTTLMQKVLPEKNARIEAIMKETGQAK